VRVLIISDSHGDSYAIRAAIEQQPKAGVLFFLGDGEYDIDSVDAPGSSLHIVKVKGNCDYGSKLPANVTEEINGVRFYCTHGYAENVKYTLSSLRERAVDNNAHIALYGHTHVPDTTYDDGIWLVNPGSIRQDRYAVVDIEPSGIIPILMKLR
jgi:putative phosphoesterase